MTDELLRDAVLRVAAREPTPLDPFRGMYVSDEQARAAVRSLDTAAHEQRLGVVADALELDPLDRAVLAICAGPELDARYGRLVGFLHDDLNRRAPSPRLIAALLGPLTDEGDAGVLARLSVNAPLRTSGAVRVLPDPGTLPIADRGLRIDELLAAHLLGAGIADVATPGVRDVELSPLDPARKTVRDELAAALTADDPVVLAVVGRDAEQLLAHSIRRPLVVLAAAHASNEDTLARARMRALLTGGLLVLGDLDELAPERRAEVARAAGVPLVHVAPERAALLPEVAARVIIVPALTVAERHALWQTAMPGRDVTVVAERFALGAEQIAQAAALAGDDLLTAARAACRGPLDALAERLGQPPGWQDLVLPDAELEVLRSIAAVLRHRERVLVEWGMGALHGREGLTVLFSGEPGTGKSLAAQVLANDLGLDAYRVDLSTVVSKYIGETEKNLSRIFDAAAPANAILVFDEADALFGKRSAVSDARDRYANIEVAFLLQRIEAYRGAVILTTNLRQNVDRAFLRRLDFSVEFPLPGRDEREQLWRRHLPPALPLATDVDIGTLADAHRLSGGSIANAARTAAYAAADDGGVVTPTHLEAALRMELRKLGRLSAA